MKFVWKLHVKCGNCVILQATVFFLNPRNKESVFIIIFWWTLILKWMHIQSFNYPVRPECHLHTNVWMIRETWLLVWLAELMFDWLLSRLLTHGPSLSCCVSGWWTVNVHLSIAITTLLLLQLDVRGACLSKHHCRDAILFPTKQTLHVWPE